MKKYLLIGLYQQKNDEEQPRGNFIDFLYFENDSEACKQLADVIWDKYKVELEKFNNLYLIDETPKIIKRASSFTDVSFLEMELEDEDNNGLSEYHPVYVDHAEWDERVDLSNALNYDFMNGTAVDEDELDNESNIKIDVEIESSNNKVKRLEDYLNKQ